MAKSRKIQCHYDSSKNVHDISTVSVRYRYESMKVAQRMLTVLVRFDTVLVRFTAVAVVANRGAP